MFAEDDGTQPACTAIHTGINFFRLRVIFGDEPYICLAQCINSQGLLLESASDRHQFFLSSVWIDVFST